jgi:flagellar biosynthesis protein FlhB
MSEKGTEQATPQRKKKAREKGDRAHSRELLSAVAMICGVLMLGVTAQRFVSIWGEVYSESLRIVTAGESPAHRDVIGERDEERRWIQLIRGATGSALLPVGLLMTVAFSGAAVAGVAQSGGVQFHPASLEPKFSKLNPVTNLGNLFSLRSVTRVAKSLVPAGAMVIIGWGVLKRSLLSTPVMSLTRLPQTLSSSYNLAFDAALITLAWSAFDYVVEWRSWNNRIKMSKQEIREEIRDTMGNPQIKAKIRQIQRAMRRRKVKADISRATVVITNPTHYAVALQFSFETMSAPTVLAKGRDLLAAEIREEARWAGVPLIENPPLARSLYKLVEPGQSIPFELYSAVAGILAYLYRQKVEERIRSARQSAEQSTLIGAKTKELVGMRGFGGGM